MTDRPLNRQLSLWAAQGFGAGWIPFAPGTFGSVVGFGWAALLLIPGRLWVFVLGSIALLPAAVWLCGAAEETLERKDPGSVVLDEIAAVPVCLWTWAAVCVFRDGSLPEPGGFLSRENWRLLLVVFAAFRFFDILKPWPVRQSQRLPGGWGVVVDDVLAAFYVNLVLLAGWLTGLL